MGLPRPPRAAPPPARSGGGAAVPVDTSGAPPAPRLLAISSGAVDPARPLEDRAFDAWLSALAEVSGVAVLLREKHLGDRALCELASAARRRFAGLLLVSGRADVAVAAGADGVHLPATGLPAAALRRRFPQLVIGVSTHSAAEVAAAFEQGVCYATFGPVFATPSKLAFGPPQGLKRLHDVSGLGLPVLALGGIDIDQVPAVLAAGAWGIAGIRCFADRAAARRLAAAIGAKTDRAEVR